MYCEIVYKGHIYFLYYIMDFAIML